MRYAIVNVNGSTEIRQDSGVLPVGVKELDDIEYAQLMSGTHIMLNGAIVIAPPPPIPHPNVAIDAQIAELEGKTERGIRESVLYTLVALAAASGITEPQLYAANYGYRKARDTDNAIAALRAQRV